MSNQEKRIDLKSIKDPSFLKCLDYKGLKLLCKDIRTEIIKQVSMNGGHLASNLGVVELTVALHRSFNFPKDKLLFDVGHQTYAHKILTGRKLDNLNSAGAISGFAKMSESEYDCYDAGHSSTSLSAAEAFAVARDLKGEKYDVVALIGDASIANGLSFEALNNISFRNNKVIIVLNDNDMSISRPIGALSNVFRGISTARGYNKLKVSYRKMLTKTSFGRGLYSFSRTVKNKIKQWLVSPTIFEEMGFAYIGVIDGHNIRALEKAFSRAKNTTKSVVIHVFTKKGKGYPLAEKDQIGEWHSVEPFDIKSGIPINRNEGKIPFAKAIGSIVNSSLKENANAVLICPAMVKGSYLDDSFKEFPERCFDMGISEEHAMTFAGSISLTGFHPILCVYSTFLQRAYDELLHDCARIKSDMTLLIDKAGLIGKNGETHMGIYDEAFLKSIPDVIVSMPSDISEAKTLLEMSLEKGHGVFAIRYDNHSIDEYDKNEICKIDFLKWKFVQQTECAKQAVIAVGPNGKALFSKLKENDFDGMLINPIFLNPVDYEVLNEILNIPEIIIYDAYGTENGFAESVEKYLLDKSYKGKVKVFALPNVFIEHDTIENQEKTFGVSVEQVFDYIVKK